MRRWLAPFWIALAVLILAKAPAAAGQQWIEIKSPHLSVITDAGEQRGREIAARFEQVRAGFGITFPAIIVRTIYPVQVVAFGNGKEFHRFAAAAGRPGEVSGFRESGEDRSLFAVDATLPVGWEMVLRDYARLLVESNFPTMPSWFDEGFTEYCASATARTGELEFGATTDARAKVLRKTPWIHLDDVFDVRNEKRQLSSPQQMAVFEAESWVTAQYLMAHDMSQQLWQFFELTEKQDVAVIPAAEKAFGITSKQLENRIRDYYINGQIASRRAPAPAELGDTSRYPARKLSDLEWLTVWADLQYHSKGQHERGVATFRDVLKKDPGNVAANIGLAYDYITHNDFDVASEYLGRASAAGGKDATVHYLNAVVMNRKAAVAGAPLPSAAMRKEIEAVQQLDPSIADAYYLLARVEMAENNLEAQRAAIAKAVSLNSRNEIYLLTQAQAELRAQNTAAAEPVLARLADSENAQIAEAARELLDAVPGAQPRREQPRIRDAQQEIADSKWQNNEAAGQQEEEKPEITPPPSMASIRFLKGQLVKTECGDGAGAVLTVSSGGKTWTMFTRDRKSLLMIGPSSFSCSWANKGVSMNYRLQPDGRGELVSLEVE